MVDIQIKEAGSSVEFETPDGTEKIAVQRSNNETRFSLLAKLAGYMVTTAGDIVYATGSRVLARLGIGTAGQVLAVNSGATAPEWVDKPNDNLLINGGFRVNQRAYVSSATLASGAYGHDRWKAGAGGGDYTFTQLASATQITVEAGKTLIQVVEDKNVAGGSYVLSWDGTAQARAGVDSATPSGAYADSPLAISSQTAGTVMSVEFDDGTLGKAKLELATVATPYVPRPYAEELALCQRYFFSMGGSAAYESVGSGVVLVNNEAYPIVRFPVSMRNPPTLGYSAVGDWTGHDGASAATSALAISNAGILSARIQVNQAGTTWTVGRCLALWASNTINARLTFSAEL